MTQYLPVLEMVTNVQLLKAKLKMQIWLLRLKLNQPYYKEWSQITEQPAPTSATILSKSANISLGFRGYMVSEQLVSFTAVE